MNLKVEVALPSITSNFALAREQLAVQLKEYDLVVDQGSVKKAKAMATEINKVSKRIDTLRKEKVAELYAPIKDFELEAKSLSALCQESRQKLLSQVKVFENKELQRADKLLKQELDATYTKYGVNDEFKIVKVSDLSIISNLTKTGLAAKARKAIDERVLEAKRFQEKVETRLNTLEAICYKGGLQAPLTRANIEHFLKESDDDIYLEKLLALIKNEIARLNEMRQREEKKKTSQQPASQPQTSKPKSEEPQVTQVAKATPKDSRYAKFKNDTFATKSSKRTYTVTAVFEVEVDERQANGLADALVRKFAKAGFKTVPTVYVEQASQVA